ncbi:MAG: SAM-dependent methyltransferase [Bdellovibrionia bacterium]
MSKLYAGIAHSQFMPDLKKEVGPFFLEHERLLVSKTIPEKIPLFAQVQSFECEILHVASISQAAKALRERGKFWAGYSPQLYRRTQLISEQLPQKKVPLIKFAQIYEGPEFGFFSLLNANEILIAPHTKNPFPLGEVLFEEDKVNPPSRAYLKLWELISLHGITPQKNQTVLDFGSCPGGWTWVLQSLGCKVVSVDKAPLAPQVASLPNVTFRKQDAFKLKPNDIGPLDWFFSDIICYPKDLIELIEMWTQSGLCKNFVCTVKFQGETDFASLDILRSRFGAKIVHLYYNKHEVTAIITPTNN